VQVGEVFRVPVRLRNKGALTWLQAGAHPTRLAYHWEPGDPSALAEYDGLRTDLPANVPPGGVIDLVGTVRAPRTNGKYRLRWDLVEEFVTWFSDRGNEMPDQPVDVGNVEPRPAVEESGGVEANAAATGAPSSPTIRPAQRDLPPPRPPRRLALWRAAVVLWQERPLLGIGPDNFRRRYEAVLSPAPDGQPYTDTRLHANNLYFETLADLGLAGIVSLAFIAFALFRLLRKHYAAGHLARLACGVSGGIFFVHGVIDYFLEFTPLFGLFWVLLALTATEE
jgi:hypothetical protein